MDELSTLKDPTDIRVNDRVIVANTRFALSASPYASKIAQKWAKYGNRAAVVESMRPDENNWFAVCTLLFDDGDKTEWEAHLLRKVRDNFNAN